MMVDTNVVIDLVVPGSPWSDWAERIVAQPEAVTASVIVVAELAPSTGTMANAMELLTGIGIAVAELDAPAAFRAGQALAAFRAAGGKRDKLLGDFLIGAHAAARNLPLATRDPKPYRTYFPELTLITPETHP
jgi:predicted nucleic acid-binding protein